MEFGEFQTVCKFMKYGRAESKRLKFEPVCERPDRIPRGNSWGTCDEQHCPYYGIKIGTGEIYMSGEKMLYTIARWVTILRAMGFRKANVRCVEPGTAEIVISGFGRFRRLEPMAVIMLQQGNPITETVRITRKFFGFLLWEIVFNPARRAGQK